jgi:thioredoxin reductase
MQTQASNKTIANKNEQAQVAIIGGGLAGLYSAYLLAQQNIARSRWQDNGYADNLIKLSN